MDPKETMSPQAPPKKPTKRAKAPALERVKLEREHTHLGNKHPPGTELLVTPDTARWLRGAGVVSPATHINTQKD
jgi:hypothetical protein